MPRSSVPDLVIATLLGVALALSVPSAHAEEGTEGVRLRYLGHSSFQITTPAGRRIVIDPYASNEWPGLPFPPVHADQVFMTHPHWDHDAWREVMGDPKPITGAGTFEKGDLVVRRLPGRHAPIGGEAIDHENVVLVIEIDDGRGGLRLCHPGDNGPVTPDLAEAIGPIDVLMLPVDSERRVLTYEQAEDWIAALSPRIVIPMHYKVPGLSLDHVTGLGTLDEWLSSLPGGRPYELLASDTFVLGAAESLPDRGTALVRVLTLPGQIPTSAEPGGRSVAGAAEAREAAGIALGDGDMTTAMDRLIEATRLDPEDPIAHQQLGYLYLSTKRPDRALVSFENGARLAGEERPRIASLCWLGSGMALDLLARREEALEAYRRVIALEQNDELQADHARRYLETPYREE